MLTNNRLQKIAAYLVFAGLLMSFVAIAITNEAIRAGASKGLLYTELIEKPPIYYPFHAGQLFAMLTAGVLALIALRKQIYKIGFYPLILLIVTGLYIALRGYEPSDIFSKRIVNPRGPLQCWISIAAFAAVYYGNWKIIGRGIHTVAILLSLYCAYLMLILGTVNRTIAMNNLTTPLNPLYWTGLYTLMVVEGTWPTNIAKWCPIGIYALGAIITQTRLNLLMVALAFVAYLFLRVRGSRDISKPIVTVVFTAIGIVVMIVVFSNTSVGDLLEFYSAALQNRFTQDSRSGQLIAFFSDVPLGSLVFGRGAEAAWNWDGELWKGGTDVGYLSVLFFGGVPMLVGMYCFLIRPAFRNIFEARHKTDLIAPIIVVLFAIRMFSSEFPSLDIEYYPILLAAGRCWGYLSAASRQRQTCSAVLSRPVWMMKWPKLRRSDEYRPLLTRQRLRHTGV
jgi:hypothetical protein